MASARPRTSARAAQGQGGRIHRLGRGQKGSLCGPVPHACCERGHGRASIPSEGRQLSAWLKESCHFRSESQLSEITHATNTNPRMQLTAAVANSAPIWKREL